MGDEHEQHLYISMMMCCVKCEEIIVENMEEVCGECFLSKSNIPVL
jgi:hypothetical protein